MIIRILLFLIRLISILHYIDIAFYFVILIITEVLSLKGKIKECRIRVNFVVIISVNIIFSKNLLAIV
jgi:hypothetical protein